jgi:hypothetical protein
MNRWLPLLRWAWARSRWSLALPQATTLFTIRTRGRSSSHGGHHDVVDFLVGLTYGIYRLARRYGKT